MKKIFGWFLILLGIGLLLFYLRSFFPRVWDYHTSRILYEDIEREYTQDEEEPVNEMKRELVDMETTKYISEYACIDVDGEALFRRNEDYIGWIYIPDTDISYPVVLSKDNEDYLHTNFYHRKAYSGTIFMDYRCRKGILNHHSILYGHNMKNGSMFAGLHKFKDRTYVEEHPVFWFITREHKLLYRIFTVNQVDIQDTSAYSLDGIDYQTNLDFLYAIQNLKSKSMVDIEYEPDEEDYVISLTTCTSAQNERLMVSGILIGTI